MTKLEQVARALAMEDDEEFGSNAWEAYLPMARAAIEAMREPNEAMVFAAAECDEFNTFEEEWAAAIDAALSEKPDAS